TETWPIFTDSNYGDAEVDMGKTKKAMDTLIKPLIEKGHVLVFPGFVGRSPEGKITTLGRGGSDITAVLLGSTLDADEVVFVKDVGGVLSADPKRVNGAKKIDVLNAEEAFTLTLAGAKILHPRALKYKHGRLALRVVGFDEPDFSSGTVIRGEIKSDLQAALDDSKVSMIAVVGEELKSSSSTFRMLSEAMTSGSRIVGITLTESSLLLYAQGSGPLVERLHDMIKTAGVAKAIHCFEPLAMIVVSGPDLERIPGVVDGVVGPLAKGNINLYGIVTISSSIRLFVPWDSREQALTLINANIEEFKNNKGNGA
ncbi:MAG: aspartate kinase, partial [Candidatus Bathyarchaeia archaeon]